MKIIPTFDLNYYEMRPNGLALISKPKYENEDLGWSDDFKMPLPVDLIYTILKMVFYKRLRTKNFVFAFGTCLINRDMMKIIYREIYGWATISIPEMGSRICKTLMLVDTIYEDFITDENVEQCSKAAVSFMHSKGLLSMYHPWNFREEIQVNSLELETLNGRKIHSYCGENFGDTVWVIGSLSKGIIDAAAFFAPVIPIIFTDYTGTLMLSRKKMRKTNTYRKFSELLVYIFGPMCKVLFMVKPDNQEHNPFVTDSDQFVFY
jgi:hypothetical protein